MDPDVEAVISFCLVLEVVLAEEELSFCPALELVLDEEGVVCSCHVLDLGLDEKVEISSYFVLDLALAEKDEVRSCPDLQLALDGETVASSYLVLVRISVEHSPPAIGVCPVSYVQIAFFHLLLHGVLPELYMEHSDGKSLLALDLYAAVESHLDEGRYFLGWLLQIAQLVPAKFYRRLLANFYLNLPPIFERYLPPLSSGVLAVVNSLPASACANLLRKFAVEENQTPLI